MSRGGGGAGVFDADKLFILPGSVLGVNYLFHSESVRNYLFQKDSMPPPP